MDIKAEFFCQYADQDFIHTALFIILGGHSYILSGVCVSLVIICAWSDGLLHLSSLLYYGFKTARRVPSTFEFQMHRATMTQNMESSETGPAQLRFSKVDV